MTTRRILAHLGHAVLGFLDASRLAGKGAPIASREAVRAAHAACEHLVDAAHLISPSAGVRVAEAARRAFDDAHRRTVERDADAHGLDERCAASCAPEGTGGLVVDVAARSADEEGLGHEAEGSAAFCACEAPVVPGAWVDVATMKVVEAMSVCSRCGREVAKGAVQ